MIPRFSHRNYCGSGAVVKKKMLSGIAGITMILFLVGCETTGHSQKLDSFVAYRVSEPSGAVIEINNEYVGKTPLTVDLTGWQSTRTFARNHTIVAHPVAAGGQTQIKFFQGGTNLMQLMVTRYRGKCTST